MSTSDLQLFQDMILAESLSESIEESISGKSLETFDKRKRSVEDDLARFTSPTKISTPDDITIGLQKIQRFLKTVLEMCLAAIGGFDELLESDTDDGDLKWLRERVLRHRRRVAQRDCYFVRNYADIYEYCFARTAAFAGSSLTHHFFKQVSDAIRDRCSDESRPMISYRDDSPQTRARFESEADEVYELETKTYKDKFGYTYKWCVVLGDWVRVGIFENDDSAQDTPTHLEKMSRREQLVMTFAALTTEESIAFNATPLHSHAIGQIFPHALEGVDLGYLFGVGEPFLDGPENAIPLQQRIYTELDNQRITICPLQPADSNTVSDYKLIVLNPILYRADAIRYTNKLGEHCCVGWKELDGKVLSWPNHHRPARRFLYLRHLVAMIRSARDGNMPFWKDRVPHGTIWASPGRPEGYLRFSVLEVMATMLGDRLPEEYYGPGLAFQNSSVFPSDANMDYAVGIQMAEVFQEWSRRRKRRISP